MHNQNKYEVHQVPEPRPKPHSLHKPKTKKKEISLLPTSYPKPKILHTTNTPIKKRKEKNYNR
jgi:hypothetical protein